MAGKGSVNIKIGGDASEYKKELTETVKATEEAAQKIDSALSGAAKSLSDGLVDAYKGAQKEQEKAVKSISSNVGKIAAQNNEVIGQKDKLGGVYDKLGEGAKTAGTKIKAGLADIKAGIDMAAAAANKLSEIAAKGINYNATIESLQTSFEVMTGSATKAADVVDRLRKLGAETPFEMADLAGTTQLLMQYGFTADDAISKMSMLGDIAQGNAQAMTSIATGYAQMSSAGKVNLQDIKQMINAGFNPLQEISERTGESMSSLYDRISKGKMNVDEITKSMQMATSEGGKFYQSMEKQSKTLNGQLSTLKDNADQLLGTLTVGMSEGLRDEFLPLANNMIGELQNAFETGGIRGLSDAATNMIPNLLDMMSSEFEKGITAIGKWLPKGASSLMKHIPQALSNASSVIPQITTALFGVATVVIADLTGMLPELIPTVVKGFGSTLLAALDGIEKLTAGFFTGVEKIFHQGQKKIAGVWVDKENVAKYSFDLDMNIGDAETEIETAYKNIRDALNTDLLSDPEKQQIIDMIGKDYEEIKTTLLSFGLSEEEAKPIATAIANAGKALEKAPLSGEQKTEIMEMIGQDYSAIKAKLMSFGLNEKEADKIASAFAKAGEALETDVLTDTQKAEIENMIGEDYQAIKDKLLSFGLSDEEAGVIASAVVTAGNKMIEAYSGLNIGIDPVTLAKLTKQSNGSRIVMKGLLKDMGLKDTDIAQVLAVYDEMMGKVGEGTPSIMEEIYDKLSDGKPDDKQTVDYLKGQITTYISGLLTNLDEAYKTKLNELDATADDYDERKKALDEWYESSKTAINGMNTEMSTLVDTLAGAPTEVVKARMDEFVEMERRLLGIEEEINSLTAKARSAAENAFSVVRSGANADEATISQAISFKVTEFKMDEQSAEDAYAAAIEQLNADYTSGKISKTEFNAGVEAEGDKLSTAKETAKNAFEKAMTEIFQGIAESEGNTEALNKAMEAVGAKMSVQDFLDNMFDENGNIDQTKLSGLSEQLSSVLGDAFNADTLQSYADASSVDNSFLMEYLGMMLENIDAVSTDNLAAALGGKVGEAWAAALESGVLTGTDFDVSTESEQLNALYYAIGYEAGENTYAGLDDGIAAQEISAYKRGQAIAAAFMKGYKTEAQIFSPSRAMRRLGKYTGEGLELGLQDSMNKAVSTAKRIAGQIVTAADISRDVRVNVPGLQQEIVGANQQTSTPVYLNGKQIAEIQGHNNSTQIAWQNTKAAKGVGSR